MALQTPPAATQDLMARWWPSRYGAEDEAFLLVISHAKLRGATGARVAPLAIV